MKYLDMVEVIKDRERYKKEGVFVGMCGVIMSERCNDGEWQVIFSNPTTACDIADILIKEEDLKISSES